MNAPRATAAGADGRALVVRARPFAPQAVAFAPGTKRLWAVGNGQISASSDGGRSWDVIESPARSNLRALAVADERLALAVGDGGVIVRKDSADDAAWTQVHPRGRDDAVANLTAVAIDAGTREAIAVGDKATVLASRDPGAPWTRITIPIDAMKGETFHAVAMSKGGVWLLGIHNVFHRDAAGKWRIVQLPPHQQQLDDVIGFEVDGRKGFISCGSDSYLWTEDGGDHWTPVPLGPGYGLRAVDFERDLLYATEDGSWVVSPRTRSSWTLAGDESSCMALDPVSGDRVSMDGNQIAVGKAGEPQTAIITSHMLDFVMDSDGLHGWGAGESGVVFATSDGGRHWNIVAPATKPEDRIFALRKTNDRLWALRNFSVDFSDNGGGKWQTRWRNPTSASVMSFAVTADGRRILIGGRDVIYDVAEGSEPVARQFPQESFSAVAMSADGRIAIASSQTGTLFRLENGKWDEIQGIDVPYDRGRLAMTPDGRHAWLATDSGDIVRSDDGGVHWSAALGQGNGRYFEGIDFDAAGQSGMAITESAIFRSTDGGRTWFDVPVDAINWQQLRPLAACRVTSPDDAYVSSLSGSFLATEAGHRKPVLSGLDFVADGNIIKPVVHVAPGAVPANQLRVTIDVSGTAMAEIARDKLRRSYVLSDVPSWPAEYFGSQDRYTFHVSVFDGWNVAQGTYEHRFTEPLWSQFVDWMGWRRPASISELFASTVPRNAGLLVIAYYAVILLLFFLNPYAFIVWHERIAGRLPERLRGVAKIMAPLAVGSDRCIDALVVRHADHARSLFLKDKRLQDRAGWAPAPLKIGDDEYLRFVRPPDLPPSANYIAGLAEIRRRLSSVRTVISIQGPGGVGKSTLAFQLGRWASSPDAETRLFPHLALPIIVTALERPLDDVAGDAVASLFGWSSISTPLKEALLEKKRVVAIIDGLSEMGTAATSNADTLSTARLTHAIVLTSRTATRAGGELVIAPLPLGLGSLDSALNSLIEQRLGANYFDGDQREEIRKRCVELLRASQGAGPAVPMLFLKLLVDRAAELLKNSGRLEGLPSTFNGLVDAYVGRLLNDDATLISAARQAAVVAVAQDLAPGWRPRSLYVTAVGEAPFEKLAMSGLLERSGLSAAPLYKFSIDPVSEYLAAMEVVLRMQAGTLDPDLALRLADAQGDSSFRSAILFCAKYVGLPDGMIVPSIAVAET